FCYHRFSLILLLQSPVPRQCFSIYSTVGDRPSPSRERRDAGTRRRGDNRSVALSPYRRIAPSPCRRCRGHGSDGFAPAPLRLYAREPALSLQRQRVSLSGRSQRRTLLSSGALVLAPVSLPRLAAARSPC